MRTTVTIQDSLLERAKSVARQRKCTLGAVIDDALRRTLLARTDAKVVPPLHLQTFNGEGLLPGVNLDSSAELMDLMEDR